MRILLIGSGARELAVARALIKSPLTEGLICLGSGVNPALAELCEVYETGSLTDCSAITALANEFKTNLAFIGPEAPLAAGVADALWRAGVACIGPTQQLARIESSKAFTRDLLTKYKIPACPCYKLFNSMDGVEKLLIELGDLYVVKFDGLQGGKGVKVAGEHLHSHQEALDHCQALVVEGKAFVIEEKLIGQEFSLMSFSDGKTLAHMPAVQDHKRAFEGDTGPNTGGMGSYSDADHKLPFLTSKDIKDAHRINAATAAALKEEFGEGYKGILYGGFIATADGVKLIEYNARFGDPEAMNVLAVLETDLAAICRSIADSTLASLDVKFSLKATVCKYAVPEGYPDAPVKGQAIDISRVQNRDQLFLASVDVTARGLVEAGSRTAACVAIADTIEAAEAAAEAEISRIRGPLFHRRDIGTAKLIEKRVEQMKALRGPGKSGEPRQSE